MSHAFYNTAGLRFWRQNEIRLRERIKGGIVDCVTTTLLDLNQMWRFEEVDCPVLMPRAEFHAEYKDDDLFLLDRPMAGEAYALRGETTNGSYKVAKHLLDNVSGFRAPLGVYASGQSFRREESDGATAAKLRFYAFYQLEFQLIYSDTTTAPIPDTLRNALREQVEKITGQPTRLVQSDRVPAYASETIDIEVEIDDGQGGKVWKEVASTSVRIDFPQTKDGKGHRVFEVAFGLDRMVVITQGVL